jgi:type I restriction enzyme S subunit
MMGRPMATSQDFVNWVCGDDLEPRYLFYILLSEQESIRRFAHGTTHQTLYYPEAKALHVCIPPIAQQRAIAEALGALDDKIEANRRLSALSHVFLQQTWRQAAVSNRPEGIRLGRIADLDKGLSYKGAALGSGVPLVNLANFGTDGTFHADGLKRYSGEARDRHWVHRGDLVIANTDLTQRREILGQPALVQVEADKALFTHHVFAVRTRTPVDRLWLYAALRDQEFRDRAQTFATGTTVAGLPKDAVLTYEVPWPEEGVRLAWAKKARLIVDRAESALRESIRLIAVRDVLLPALLSGAVKVRSVEELVGEAV